MAKIEFSVGVSNAEMRNRRTVDAIIGGVGASARGSSYYKSLMICPREHALTNEVGVRAVRQNENFAVGTLFHLVMEVYYGAIMRFQKALDADDRRGRDDYYYWGNALEAQREAWDAIAVFATEPGYTQTYAEVQRIVEAYFEKYANLDRWRVLAVEETLRFTEQGFDFSARLDLIVESEGRTWLVEHKTAKMISLDSLDHYDMDMQTLGQQWLFDHCVDTSQFPPLAGCRVNIVTKQKQPQLVRKDVCPSPAHLHMFEASIADWYSARDAMRRLGWPRALGHCAGFARGYGKCQFFDACRDWPALSVEEFAANLPDGFVIQERGAENG